MTADPPEQLGANDFLYEPTSARLYQVKDIVCLQPGSRSPNYTDVTLANGKRMTVRKSLVRILPRLPRFFFLARRGWVINLLHVRDMAPIDKRKVTVTLSDLSEVLISREQLLTLGREWGL